MAVSIDKAVIARLKHLGKRFEILIDPYKALELRRGAKLDVSEILAYPAVYKDAKSTEVVAESDLQKTFGTVDVFKIAERIIKEGELQLTTEQRREMVEKKRSQIVDIISKRGVNPQTNSPNPPQRILSAMDQAGVEIDPFLDAEMQIEKVLKAIKPIIPISFEKITIQLKIPAQFAGKSYLVLKKYGDMASEQWLGDGSLQVSIRILAGIREDMFEKIASLTHGQFESKVIKREE